jgi:SAM-dependent methyltransferase
VREFTAEYLETTRTGMWADSRAALSILDLGERERILDAGAGTGELTRVLREESPGTVVALDADRSLLKHVDPPAVAGDTLALPFADDSFDLVVCQALLVNLVEPRQALAEFARVSADAVAVIEPDNSAVTVESTVDAEPTLARRARRLYLEGADTDPALGAVRDLFEEAGLSDIRVRRYDHERTVEPPYTEDALESARRKATGAGLATDRETILAGETTSEEFDSLRAEWRAMGRSAIEQIQNERYRRREVVPFFVTVGTVPA